MLTTGGPIGHSGLAAGFSTRTLFVRMLLGYNEVTL